MALYTDTVMDHFLHPRNVGEIADADGVGEVGNAKCGDIMKMYLKIKDGKIEDVKFETFGCGSAIASSSMATEMIKGKSIEDALALTNREVVDALGGLPAHKLHCSVLAEEAVKSAVKDYYDKNGIAYDKSKFPACEDCGDFTYLNPGSVSIPKENSPHSYMIYEDGVFSWKNLETGETYRTFAL